MKKIFLFLLFIFCSVQASAAPRELDYSSFGLLPILHEGRIKPLDSYARIKLIEFSGRDTISGKPAIAWLAKTVFDPAAATELKLFEIPNLVLKDHLGLDKKNTLYALVDLVPALKPRQDEITSLLQIEEKNLTSEQADLLLLHKKILNYSELLRSFSAIMPLNLDIPEAYKKINRDENNYLGFRPVEEQIQAHVIMLVKAKGANPAKYKDEEKKLTDLAFALEDIRTGGARNKELKIIYENGEWFTPWEILLSGNNDYGLWLKIASAYRENNVHKWKNATQQAHPPGSPDLRLRVEVFYNSLNPFQTTFGFYILGIIILAAEIHRKTSRILFPLICAGAGLFLHIAGIIMRIYILERAPVGTLYESLLFVSLICMAASLVLYIRKKNFTFLFAGFISAALLLFIAPFLLQQGESLEMLVAVLNTNFWLGLHVLCITTGYGVAILAGVLAHCYFIMRLRNTDRDKLISLQTAIYRVSLVALFFTAIGTILGGIWADQSWGRFWGWDPKENGALLIVLWIIWLQHGRMAGKLNILALMAAIAFLNVIVALAWFGVNLLNVGLHSYGFISGIASSLLIFCILEILTIACLWSLNVKKAHHA